MTADFKIKMTKKKEKTRRGPGDINVCLWQKLLFRIVDFMALMKISLKKKPIPGKLVPLMCFIITNFILTTKMKILIDLQVLLPLK